MPREFIPKARKREPHSEAKLFPRTGAQVVCGAMHRPPADRMMREDRRITKRELHNLAARPDPDYVHD